MKPVMIPRITYWIFIGMCHYGLLTKKHPDVMTLLYCDICDDFTPFVLNFVIVQLMNFFIQFVPIMSDSEGIIILLAERVFCV